MGSNPDDPFDVYQPGSRQRLMSVEEGACKGTFAVDGNKNVGTVEVS